MASTLLLYSVIYISENQQNDFFKQYVTSLTITALMLTLKDVNYICPDGNPTVTIILLAGGAYTPSGNKPDWADVSSRLLGQAVGFGLVYAVMLSGDNNLLKPSLPEYTAPFYAHVINQGLATTIECVATAFAILPLLKASVDGSGFNAKSQAAVPTNKNLWFAAVSLGLIHYVLERGFRASMNPLTEFLFIIIQYDGGVGWWVVLSQFVGLAIGCGYVATNIPTEKIMQAIGAEK